MISFSKAKKKDFLDMIKVMRNTGYVDYSFPEKSDKEVETELLKSNNKFFICSDKNKIIGYFVVSKLKHYLDEAKELINLNEEFAYHFGIGIHSDYRRQSLALKLTEFVLENITQNFKGIYADVASNNFASLKLHEKLGFEKLIEYNSKKRAKGTKNVLFCKSFK